MSQFLIDHGPRSSKGRNVSFYILAGALLILITMSSLIFNYLWSQTITEEVMVPMRDGVKLHTKISRPARSGSYPVVLTRGYWPGYREDYKRFTKAGYVYVGQSTRGHGQSEGSEGVANRFLMMQMMVMILSRGLVNNHGAMEK